MGYRSKFSSGISIARIVSAPAGGRYILKRCSIIIIITVAAAAENVSNNPSCTVRTYRHTVPVSAHINIITTAFAGFCRTLQLCRVNSVKATNTGGATAKKKLSLIASAIQITAVKDRIAKSR